MKKNLLLSITIFFALTTSIVAQCAAFATDHCTNAAPVVIGNSINCNPPLNDAGRRNFRVTNMIANATYRVSNCGAGVDTQMTIRDLGGAVVGYNDDGGPACTGTAASIDFIPPATGDYRIQVNEFNCATTPSFNETGDITVTLIADPPPPLTNDDPCSAIALTVNTPCTFATYTNLGATDSGIADPGCAFYSGGDVWFSVTVPPSGSIIIDTDTGGITDSGMATYSGTCGALTLIECDDDDSANGLMSSITNTGLTPGYTIFIRVWEYNNDNQGTFDICVSEPSPPPANDECINAIGLTVNPDLNCGVTTPGTTDSATASPQIDDVTGTPNNDVWYSFVATDTAHVVSLLNVVLVNGSTDMGIGVYDGSSGCSALTFVNDSDPNTLNLAGLTVGNLYYVRIYGWFSSASDAANFDVCVSTDIPCILPSPITTVACPIVDVTPDTSTIGSCTGGSSSVDLTATYMDLGDTSDYNVDLITYDQTIFNNFAAAATNTIVLAADDRWSDNSYTMPFDFCFYGNSVTDFIIGANGSISFDASLANTASGYSFNDNLPSTNGALVENAIYGVFHDIDPSVSGTISYGTTIVNGCNALVVLWDDIPMFSNNSLLHTAIIVMYENTNIIEVHIEEKVIDGTWNGGNAIVGIQNPGATNAVVAPCRNGLDTNWATTNEAWRFTPSGGSSIANIEWLVNSVPDPSYDGQTTISVSPAITSTYTAQVTYTLCNATTLTISEDAIVNIGGNKLWNGLTDADWNVASNWTPAGVPTNGDPVTIPATVNNPIIYGTTVANACSLTVQTGAILTLDDDTSDTNYASLTIQESVTLQNNSTLHVQNNSSLVQINEGAANVNNNSGPGTFILDREPSVSNTDYVYWSSPVSDMILSNIYGADTPNMTFQWRPTIDTGNTISPPPGPCNNVNIPICDGDWEAYSGNMSIGKGYISNGPTSQGATPSNYLTSISGTLPNNGLITTTIESGINLFNNCAFTYVYPATGNNLTVTPFDDNWNLIGNPYPSAISANAFINYSDGGMDNTSIEGAIHIWTHGTDANGANPDPFYDDFLLNYNPNDYLTYNLSGTNTYPNEITATDYFIGSGQGFFVLADFDNGTNNVTFSNSMRNITHDNSNFYRSANPNPETTNTIERHRIWLNLSHQNEQTASTMVGYIEGATQAKDRSYDAYTFESNTMSIYSMIEDERMVIQGRQLPFEIEDQVPLGVDILQDGNYTISISGIDGLFETENQNIYLEDTYTNTIHDLRVSPYAFSSDIGNFYDRFILRYTNSALGIDDYDILNSIQVFEENNKIVVKSEHKTLESIEVYDILGRSLFSNKQVNSNRFYINGIQPSEITLFLKIRLVDGKQKIAKIIF